MRISTPTAVVLDSTPLSLLAQKQGHLKGDACWAWAKRLMTATECTLFIPEVADYEVRRELLRLKNAGAVSRLDELRQTAVFLPLATDAILLAATLWAETRQRGRPTSDAKALDADALITAQVRLLFLEDYALTTAVIATGDIKDMTALATVGPMPTVLAVLWHDILP